ncbi:MAG TPA: D-arabinono-1,4-lactone oxidase [Chitinophagaceae bacterium]|jgi:xylitol oxidase
MNGELKNWAGNHTYKTNLLRQAGSIEEVQSLVKKYPRLKVLGTRHCFNDIADSGGCLISLEGLNKIIALDKERQTVTVEAGVRYGELAVYLHERGYALHNMASLPHISVVGGCATATHGSGIKNGNLSTSVRAMELLTASGELLVLDREKDKEILSGAVVHLGGLGIVTSITLAIEPTYQVQQYVYENLPMGELEHHFEAIMSAGYSVSLFTDWRKKNINEVWIKARVREDGKGEREADFFGATAATQNLHPISDVPAENCTEQMGVPGAWHERLPHFRMGFTPSSGKELQTEYFVPVENAYQAIQAIEQLHEKIAPYLLISEIRCIAADELWMSPCYRQACTALHFTWQQDWPAVRELLPLVEERLAPFHAKPHWGKLFSMRHKDIKRLYTKLPDFQKLLRKYDPRGQFRNEWLDSIVF